jgi:hypothetical protein
MHITKSRLIGILSLSSNAYYSLEKDLLKIYFTASFNAFPAVNFGTVIAGI